jgi:hypothetical protein
MGQGMCCRGPCVPSTLLLSSVQKLDERTGDIILVAKLETRKFQVKSLDY